MIADQRIDRLTFRAMLFAPPAEADAARRQALRTSLRSWRSAAEPAPVESPGRTRRRPGLTRKEVGELTGMSAYRYRRFEIGCSTHGCSQRAVDRVANVQSEDLGTCPRAAFLMLRAPARDVQRPSLTAPLIAIPEGTTVEAVSVETYGVVNQDDVRRYLALRRGARLNQAALDVDYQNLVRLGGFRVRLLVGSGSDVHAKTLHWIIMSRGSS
jgi:hypothetical protein